MQLKQLHNTTFVIYEITAVSLKITAFTIFRKRTKEILFGDILIKDVYELEYRNNAILQYLFLVIFFGGVSCEYVFLKDRPDWTIPVIFGGLAILLIVLFFRKRMRIYVPTKDQGLIKMNQQQPDKRKVEQFLYELEGRVNLAVTKRPEKTDLREFISG